MTDRSNRFRYTSDNRRENRWICTFNDMMTLLMVFFVLIFSLGTLNIQDIQSARLSLQSGLGILEAGRKTSVGIVKPIRKYDSGTATFARHIEKSFDSLQTEEGIGVTFSDMEVTISLEDDILFGSGSANINPEGFHVLDKIASGILNRISNSIRIEGHTDSDPIHTVEYPSNWELSTARAVNVLKYLITKGNVLPKRLSAVGYGESKPLFQNDTEEHKRRNRRVAIVINTDKR